MFPIFVVLPFESPGGIGTKPKIICTFHRMKERAGENALKGEWEFPFRSGTCNNICVDSTIAPDSSLHLTKAALCCPEVVFLPLQISPHHFPEFSTTPGSVYGGPLLALNHIHLAQYSLILTGMLECESVFYSPALTLNRDRRWQLSGGFCHCEA